MKYVRPVIVDCSFGIQYSPKQQTLGAMVVKPLTAHAIHFCLSLQRKLHIIYFMKTPLTSQLLVNLKNE